MIKEQIARVRKVVGLVEEEAVEGNKDKAQDPYRQLVAVTLATVFDKYVQEFYPAEDENGITDDQQKEAVKEFVLMLRELVKNPTLFTKALKVAKRQKSASRVMGRAVSKV